MQEHYYIYLSTYYTINSYAIIIVQNSCVYSNVATNIWREHENLKDEMFVHIKYTLSRLNAFGGGEISPSLK